MKKLISILIGFILLISLVAFQQCVMSEECERIEMPDGEIIISCPPTVLPNIPIPPSSIELPTPTPMFNSPITSPETIIDNVDNCEWWQIKNNCLFESLW